MTYTMDQLRTMDDGALNRVVLERLGYTAPDRRCDPPWFLLLGADGLTASNWDRRIYFDLADFDKGEELPDGWKTDGNDYYTSKIGWDSEVEAFASGPQYVSDLNLVWGLPNLGLMVVHRYENGGASVTIPVGHEFAGAYTSDVDDNPARAIVLAWLSMAVKMEVEGE